ncbi:MAG TPA: CBS domain-containing protein [Bryobacteraceae bacterium]|jgi:CBS domain-containing protein|nr:CBS domain-containing protein [Bryobacteraceae bacterium]
MKVRELMTKTVASCHAETNLAAAGALMWESDCGFLPVVDDYGKVTGVLTDRDVCIAVTTADRKPSAMKVEDVVKGRAVMCNQDDDIRTVLNTMQKHRIRRLPAVSKAGLLEGIVSLNDIVLRATRSGPRQQAADISFGDIVQAIQTICAPKPPRSHHAHSGNRTADAA